MRRLLAAAALAVMLVGCAGIPGTPKRAVYNLCIEEGKSKEHCVNVATKWAGERIPPVHVIIPMR